MAVTSRCARGDRRARAARHEPRGACATAWRRSPSPGTLCLIDGFRVRRLRPSATGGDRRRRAQRRDRRGIGDREGDARPLHAARCRGASGLALPHQRRLLDTGASRGDPVNGISALHRRSFQSDRLSAARDRLNSVPVRRLNVRRRPRRARWRSGLLPPGDSRIADRVEADVAEAASAAPEPLGQPRRAPAAGPAALGRPDCLERISGPSALEPARATIVFTSQKTSVAAAATRSDRSRPRASR